MTHYGITLRPYFQGETELLMRHLFPKLLKPLNYGVETHRTQAVSLRRPLSSR